MLGYPNREVRAGLNRSLLRALAGDPPGAAGTADAGVLDLLEARDADGLRRLLRAFFAGIPYEWFTRNDIARFEGYYASAPGVRLCGFDFDPLDVARSGPVVPADHYCVPPLQRFDLEEVLHLVRAKRYFVLHAPRQTGKTSALLALRGWHRGGRVEREYALGSRRTDLLIARPLLRHGRACRAGPPEAHRHRVAHRSSA